MVLSKGWPMPDAISMPVAQLWEKAVKSTPPAPTWLRGKFSKKVEKTIKYICLLLTKPGRCVIFE